MLGGSQVVCAGIIVVDHVAAPVDRIPDAGQLVLTDECFLTLGGCASNVAVDLAKMQVATAVNGCVGTDILGEFACRFLRDHGVDTSHVFETKESATSQTLIVNVKGQDRRFIHLLGASSIFAAEHMPRERIAQAKVLYVGGYFLMERLVPRDVADLFSFAHRHGVVTMLDVVTPGPMNYQAALEIVLPQTDVFLPNTDEARLMSGIADPIEQASAFREMGAKTVVITCGNDGSVLLSERDRLRAKSFVVPFVDGTGGGDAFDAGYICGVLGGATARRCLELGSALGASCVQKSGATSGVFTRQQADEFLSTHRLEIESI